MGVRDQAKSAGLSFWRWGVQIVVRHPLSQYPIKLFIHWIGILMMANFPLVNVWLHRYIWAQVNPTNPNSPINTAWGAAATTLAIIGPLFFAWLNKREERADARANLQGQLDRYKSEMAREKAESDREKAEVKAKAEAAETKVHQAILETEQLRRQLGDVTANKARIAVTDGKVDAVLEELRLSGFLKPPRPGEGQRSPRTTVLIAEDDPNQARALQMLLTAKGYAASSAVTMEEGFSLLEKGPHLMILDLRIQGKDGLDLLRKVRADGKLTRTVIVTGMADPVELAKAEVLRPDKILKKPVDFEELLEVLTPLDSGRGAEADSGSGAGSDGPRPA
jgi:CheY-like chemotaxis protein